MSNALAKSANQSGLSTMDESELIGVLQSSLYPGASLSSIKMVLGYCRAAGLDPMQKPCHLVPMWDSKAGAMRDVVMPGIGLYRTQAARSGQYAGVTDADFGPDVTENIGGVQITYPQWCRVAVKRIVSGQIVEFSAKEFWKENYAVKGGKDKSIAPNAMWQKRPYGQISKCAEAQALRKAFPEVGSAPTADEMEGKEFDHQVQQEKVIEEVKPYPAEDFARNLPKWRELIESGRKTGAQIAAMVNSKAPLTPEQEDTLLALRVKPVMKDTGEFTEAELEEIRARELAEANQ